MVLVFSVVLALGSQQMNALAEGEENPYDDCEIGRTCKGCNNISAPVYVSKNETETRCGTCNDVKEQEFTGKEFLDNGTCSSGCSSTFYTVNGT